MKLFFSEVPSAVHRLIFIETMRGPFVKQFVGSLEDTMGKLGSSWWCDGEIKDPWRMRNGTMEGPYLLDGELEVLEGAIKNLGSLGLDPVEKFGILDDAMGKLGSLKWTDGEIGDPGPRIFFLNRSIQLQITLSNY